MICLANTSITLQYSTSTVKQIRYKIKIKIFIKFNSCEDVYNY